MGKVLFTGMTVEVKGLEATLLWIERVDPKLQKAFKRGLRESVEEAVLPKARAKASRIADDGTYAGSLSVSSRANGAQYVLKSTDRNAGVKEFANPGATYRYGPGRGRTRVGVPRRAAKPRAMVPAVEESAERVLSRIDERMAEILDEVNGLG